MSTDYMSMIYEQIETTVARTQRDLRRGVLPRDVQARLPYSRAEGSLRRDMLQMYDSGMLVRVGGRGARRGYRVPTLAERVSYSCNGGRWPPGTEQLIVGARCLS